MDTINLIIRRLLLPFLAAGLAGSLCAQTLTDLGPAAPSPGTNDISQLSTSGNQTYNDAVTLTADTTLVQSIAGVIPVILRSVIVTAPLTPMLKLSVNCRTLLTAARRLSSSSSTPRR